MSLVTDLPLARAIVEALRWGKPSGLEILALNDYVARGLPSRLKNGMGRAAKR